MEEVTIELPQDMQRLCRTCMSLLDDCTLENNLMLNEQPTDICEMLVSLTNMKIVPKDGLPETLCSQCISQLQISYIYKEQCLKVEQHLKNLMNNTFSEESGYELKELKLNNEDLSYFCLLCNETFETLYSLSRHTIQHDLDKSLSDRYISAQMDEYKFKPVEIPSVNENLVAQRKSDIEINDSSNYGLENVESASESNIFIFNNDDSQCNEELSEDFEEPPLPKKAKIDNPSLQVCPICNYCTDLGIEKDSHNCAEIIGKDMTERISLNKNGGEGPKICNICDRTFDNDLTLSLHFLKHALLVESETDPKIFSQYIFCDSCGMTFDTNEELVEHIEEQHDQHEAVTWECAKCCLLFESELDLLIHDREVGHSKEYFWDEFLNKEVSKDTFSCPMCEEKFPSRELLNKHSVQHAIKKVRCRRCKAFFSTIAAYNIHLKSHPNYVHTCDLCGKVLSSKSSLKTHMMGVHSSQKPFICPVCGKSFKTPNRLHLHKMIHAKDKKFVCSYCGYSTNKGGDLTVHIRTHTEERPYKCSYVNCGRGFKTSSHLCEHVRRHLQIKNFRCNICSMVFGHHNTLKIHLMQHTGEKPFQCILCNANFRRKHHLKNHMKQHDSK